VSNEGILDDGLEIITQFGGGDDAISENGDSSLQTGDESDDGEASGLSSVPGMTPLNMDCDEDIL
jgi:hypothetical protein